MPNSEIVFTNEMRNVLFIISEDFDFISIFSSFSSSASSTLAVQGVRKGKSVSQSMQLVSVSMQNDIQELRP